MKIIFCGGGTAGHISPAVAMAETIKEIDKKNEILFIGRKNGEENNAVINASIDLKTLDMLGLERKLSINNIKSIYKALKAQKICEKIIADYSPDVVVGTGGYVCWPVLRAAQKKHIPTVIHESNASPGLVTKLLSRQCNKVLLGLNGAQNEFKNQNNIYVVGNPVKKEFLNINKKTARKKLGITNNCIVICSFGGSGGSKILNTAIINLMKSYSIKKKDIIHIHSSGKKYYNEIKDNYPELVYGKHGCVIKPYIENMPEVIASADIIISRCGAMTLSEMAAIGCAAILIPSPNVTNDHQKKNAELFTNSGAAIMIEEKDLNERVLLDTVRKLEINYELRKTMQKKMHEYHINDCNKKAVKHIIELTNISGNDEK